MFLTVIQIPTEPEASAPHVLVRSGDFDAGSVELSASTRDRLRRAMPESTRRAYTGDLRRFLSWSADRKLLAANELTDDERLANGMRNLLERHGDLHVIVTEYVSALADLGRAPATIERALAAITAAHRAAGAGSLRSDGPRQVLRSYRRDRASTGAGVRVRKATPVTIAALRAMTDALNRNSLVGIRDTALLVLGFALGARRSELAALDIADLSFTAEGVQVEIRTSKTDRDSHGRTAALPYGVHSVTCPVRTAQAWLAALADFDRNAGPLFVRIDRHGGLGRTPTGRGSSDGRLTGQAVAQIVARTATAAGLDPTMAWSGHSLRRGFATETYRTGADPLRIARAGGWKDGSATLLGYIDDVDRWQANPLAGVGL